MPSQGTDDLIPSQTDAEERGQHRNEELQLSAGQLSGSQFRMRGTVGAQDWENDCRAAQPQTAQERELV